MWPVALASLLAGSAPELSAGPSARVRVVTIEGLRFEPAVLTVRPGERVTWINKDPFPHTVTAGNNAFDSGNLAPGVSWSLAARSAGTYPYGCSLHPTMKGTLIVKAQADSGNRR